MAWQDYLSDNPDFLKTSPLPEGEEPLTYAPVSRGLLGDLGTSAVRGAANVVESTSAGLEQLGVSNPVDEWIKEKRKISDVLKPDIDTVFNFDGTVARALKNLPETVVTSVGSTVGGAIAGGAAGGAPGAIVGGGANLLLSMGLGTYKTKKDEYLAKNPGDEDGASKYALIQASSEVGLEAISDVTAMATFGGSKLITELGKQGVKSTARNLLSISGKEIAKNAAISSAVELGTEEATYGIQATADKAYGMGQGVTAEGILETGVSTIGMSLLFGGLGAKYTINQKNQIKDALESTNKDRQSSAANIVKLELEKSGDNDLASAWDTYTASSISNGLPVKLDDKFVEMGQKINDASKVTIKDVISTNPDIQKHATDKILEAAGIGADGSLISTSPDFSEIEGGRSIEKEALAYNQAKNLGDKATRRETEIQQGRQAIESKRAEEQLSTPTSIPDPVKVLETAYQEQEYGGYQPTLPTSYLTRKELDDRNAEDLRRVAEDDITVFEEVASRYTRDKNQTKTIADLLQSPDDQLKLKMFKYMQELSQDTNDVDPVKVEANLKKMELQNLVKKEAEISKGVKGSKKVQELKKEVKEIKTKIEIRKVQEAPAVVKAPAVVETPAVVKVPVTTPAPTTEEYTLADAEKPEDVTIASIEESKGVERTTTLTPEKALEIKEAEKATLTQRKEVEAKAEAEEASIPELKDAAAKINHPLLSAVVNEDATAINSLFPAKTSGPMKKAAILKAFQKLGPKVASKHITTIKGLVEKAISETTLEDTKSVKGAKRSDAIQWTSSKTGAKRNKEEGKHKTTGQVVTIEKHSENVKGERVALWDISVDGKKVGEAKGQVAARQAAENYVAPLTKEELAAAKKLSTMRTGAKLSTGDKDLLQRYEDSLKVNKEKVEKKVEAVADVTVIDPKTGKATVVPYKAPSAEVAKKLEAATPKKLTREEELAQLMKEQEEDVDSEYNPEEGREEGEDSDTDFDAYDQEQRESGFDPDEAAVFRTKKKVAVNHNIPKELSDLLDKVKWNPYEALTELKKSGTSNLASIKYVEELIKNRERNKNKLAAIFKNADTALDHVIKSGTDLEKAIAKLIIANTSKAKRDAVKFETVLNGPKNFYKDGVITLTSLDTRVALHEFIHAVTVREMEINPQLKAKVEGLMGRVKMELLGSGRFTQYQLDYIRENNTSAKFKDSNPEGVFFDTDKEIAYGLINVREFMSQSLSSPAMVEVMKNTKLANPKGLIQTIWDAIVSIVGEALGISRMHNSALSEVLTLAVETMKQERVSTNRTGTSEALSSKVTEEFIDEQRKIWNKDTSVASVRESLNDIYDKAGEKFSDYTQGVYEGLKTINFDVAEVVRHMEVFSSKAVKSRARSVEPFLAKVRKLRSKDRKDLEFYINNYNSDDLFRESLNKLLSKHGMTNEFAKVLEVLGEIHSQAEVFGLNKFEDIKNYFPRRVKDYDGLVRYLRKQEDWGVIDEAIKAAEEDAKSNNKTLTDVDRADLVGRMLMTGRLPAAYLKTPAGLKQRSINIVNGKMMNFYYSPTETLGMHIREMTDRIEVNRMLGVTARRATIDAVRKQKNKIDSGDFKGKTLQKEIDKLQELVAKVPEMETQIENSLGDLVAKLVKDRNITEDQQRRVKDLIRSRINHVGMNKFVGRIRQAALLGTLTQFGTGVRQLSDATWIMYQSGILNTLKAAINVGAKKSIIKEQFLDFDGALRDFSTSEHWVDKAIKMSGLQLLDGFMKNVSMEASLLKAKDMSAEDFNAKWGKVFGDKVGEVHQDIINGKMSEDVEYLLASNIANFNPVFLSEMPKEFLLGGNGRILYLLKSYALKSSGNFYRESIQKIKGGDVKGGLKNLAHLGLLFVALGASTDWLVDWLNGKNPDFSDSMVDTLLSLGMASRYTVDKGKIDGPGKAFFNMLSPATNLVDLPFKSVYGLLTGEPDPAALKLLPGIGTITYNRATDTGQKKIIDSTKAKLLEQAKKEATPSADIAILNADIRKYNAGKRKEDRIAPITPGTIATARKKERSKNAK